MPFMVGIAANAYDLGTGSDSEDHRNHLEVCIRAHGMGFDSIFVFEHHFTSYVVSPSPITTIAYLAGRVPGAWLGTSVLILPAYNLTRLAEDIAYVDNLMEGRCLFGLGKGRSSSELGTLGVSRPSDDQFAESLLSLTNLLTNDRSAIRPRPQYSPEERLYMPVGAALESSPRPLGIGRMQNWSTSLRPGLGGIIFVPTTVSTDHNSAVQRARDDLADDLRLMDQHYGTPAKDFDGRLDQSIESSLVGTPLEVWSAINAIARYSAAEHIVLELAIGGRDLADVQTMVEELASIAAHHGGWDETEC